MLNQIFLGDCLDVMPREIPDKSADLIYCDILYGTGRKFKDYQDLKPEQNLIKDFYIPRIQEMFRILKDTGSIYLQMDTKINHWLRNICDDIFGYNNFRNEIVWKYNSGGISKSEFSRKHDIILFYSKTKNFTFNLNAIEFPRNKCQECKIELNKWNNLKKNIDEFGRTYRTIKSAGKIYKYYDDDPILLSDVWLDINHIQQKDPQRIGYDTQKPEKLLERIIKVATNENGIVADFFCGSGTTLAVAKKLNRNFIGCDINPHAVEISHNRLKD